MIDPVAFEQVIRNLDARLRKVETRESARVPQSAFAQLPVSSPSFTGMLWYVTNGRKPAEGAGAGTGIMAYNDGTAWRRVSDDGVVTA